MKLPFFKYSSKNLITITPVIKLAKIPNINGNEKVNLVKSNTTAASVIGIANIKENLAALSLSTFKALATVIVIPLRDTPGNAAAIACDAPIKIDCFKDMKKKKC